MYYNNRAMKERIKNKLKDSKIISQSKLKTENDKIKDENINEDDEEFSLENYRHEERKEKAYVSLFYYIDFKRYVK